MQVQDSTNTNRSDWIWNSCEYIRCEQLALALAQLEEVSSLTRIICVRWPLERYRVGSLAVWLHCVRGEPSYFHVISWTEWVQRQISAAGLYYRHNESQIRGTGKCMCMHVCWGRVTFFCRRGGEKKTTPNTSVLGLSAAITPNHSMALYKSVSNVQRLPADIAARPWGKVCRLAMMGALVWVTPTLTAWA